MRKRFVLSAGLIVLVLAAVETAHAQIFATRPEQAAKVAQLTGQVSLLKDNVPWTLSVGDTVPMKQEIVTGADGFAVFELSDGSKFEVYPNSHVTFRNNPANLKDLLDVWIGRVKIHIQKLTGQPNHNRIHTPTAVISVRGTAFFVEVEDQGEATLVVVETGVVEVQHKLLPQGAGRVLMEGEWIRIYKTQPLAMKSVDKGFFLQRAMQAVSEALYTIATRAPGAGGGGGIPGGPGGGTAPLPGDRGPSEPTGETRAPAPPPPPPPPPPPGN